MLRNKRGSAILIAMLLTAVLLVIGLSLNNLILKELQAERAVLNSGKAYFAAEAAIEDALYEIHAHLPGYQGEDMDDNADRSIDDQEAGLPPQVSEFKYQILARDHNVPCSFQTLKKNIVTPQGLGGPRWRVLPVQEAMRIPLYYYDSAGPEGYHNNLAFTVSYYLPYDLSGDNPGYPPRTKTEIGDLIRWKIVGIDRVSLRTGSMSEFFPIFGDASNTPITASTFGTEPGVSFNEGKYLRERVDNNDPYYFDPTFLITTFVDPNGQNGHKLNNLFLTNAVDFQNQELPDYRDPERNDLYVKISSASEELVCEVVKIDALGKQGNLEQRIVVETPLDTFLPVFDFALYRTIEETLQFPNADRDWRRRLP